MIIIKLNIMFTLQKEALYCSAISLSHTDTHMISYEVMFTPISD